MPTLRPHQQTAVDALSQHRLGQCIFPTGAGKTLVGIMDAVKQFEKGPATIVVVAPRILLAHQLCSEYLEVIKNAAVMHVHSGETDHFRSTNPKIIRKWCDYADDKKLVFTTYHSLHKIQEAEVDVHTIYFDEAHNSVSKRFFPAVEHFSQEAGRCYYFTATPKHSLTINKPGMNDPEVYGQVIANVPATKMVEQGYILPPKVVVQKLDMVEDKKMIAERDASNMLTTIDDNCLNKVLICARSTRQITKLVGESDFCRELHMRGYSWMYITSKTGAVIDGQKVDRDTFFKTLNDWGKNPTKRFVVMHHSILAEGINVTGLEAVLFLRKMDYIGISQSIGRVIRLGGIDKKFGMVCVPVYDKVGISTAKSVQAVVDTVFEKGEAAVSVVKR